MTAAGLHVFLYGTLMDPAAAHLLEGCARVSAASVRGTLFDIDGRFPALVLAGDGAVHGAVWRCPHDRIYVLDRHEGVGAGLFRRVGLEVDERACWVYVAGPRLASRLTPERRIPEGRWQRSTTA